VRASDRRDLERQLERLRESLAYTEGVVENGLPDRVFFAYPEAYAYGYLAQSVRVLLEAAGITPPPLPKPAAAD